MSKVTAEVVTMNPKDALVILEKQKASEIKNRLVSQKRVDNYASQMKAGKWEMNGEPIILDEEDQLLDGQHRLWACVQSDCSFKTLLVRGVDRKVFPTLDTGKARSGADVLAMAGFTSTTTLSSALQWLYLYEQKKMLWHAASAGYSHALQFALIDKHPHILDSMNWATRMRRNPVLRAIPPGPATFLHYIFTRFNEELATQFFARVGDEASDSLESATRMLRKFLIRSLRGDKPNTQELIALVVKAWSCHVGSKPIKSLTWRRFGPSREDFPIFPGDTESRGIATRSLTMLTLEDTIKFLKIRLADGPVPYRVIRAECKAKGLPLYDIEGSASLKKAIGIMTKRVKNTTHWMLRAESQSGAAN